MRPIWSHSKALLWSHISCNLHQITSAGRLWGMIQNLTILCLWMLDIYLNNQRSGLWSACQRLDALLSCTFYFLNDKGCHVWGCFPLSAACGWKNRPVLVPSPWSDPARKSLSLRREGGKSWNIMVSGSQVQQWEVPGDAKVSSCSKNMKALGPWGQPCWTGTLRTLEKQQKLKWWRFYSWKP